MHGQSPHTGQIKLSSPEIGVDKPSGRLLNPNLGP